MRVLCTSILLWLASGPLLAQSSLEQLFPLHQGDSWTYTWTDSAGSGQHHIEVIDKLYSSWFLIEGLPFSDHKPRWYAGFGSELLQWRGYYALVLDTSLAIGAPSPLSVFAPDLRNATLSLEDDGATVTVPAGTWNGCSVYSVATSTGSGLRSFTLAPGAGLIAYTVRRSTGDRDYQLKTATIDGAIYPKMRGAHVVLHTDRFRYEADAQGRVSMRARLEVATLGQPLSLQFTSGQRYDLSLSPSAQPNQPVWVWSANKLFAAGLASVDLVPGSPLLYELSFDVPQVQPGDYILRMQLVGSHRFAAETPVEISAGNSGGTWPAPSPAGSFLAFGDPDPANGWSVGDWSFPWTPQREVKQGVLSRFNGVYTASGLPSGLSSRELTLLRQAIVDIWDLALVWRYDDGSNGPEGTLSLGNAGNAGYFQLGTHHRSQDGADYDVVRWRDIDDNSFTLYYLPDASGFALKARQYDN